MPKVSGAMTANLATRPVAGCCYLANLIVTWSHCCCPYVLKVSWRQMQRF